MKTDEATKEIQLPDQETRREFLIKAGKVAIYTPPAVMLLMHPSKDALAIAIRRWWWYKRPPPSPSPSPSP